MRKIGLLSLFTSQMSEIIFQAFFFRIEKKDLIFTNLGKQEFFLHRAENIIATYSNLLPKKFFAICEF